MSNSELSERSERSDTDGGSTLGTDGGSTLGTDGGSALGTDGGSAPKPPAAASE
jgi:hypothetical protein